MCPACATPLAAGAYETHLRQAHRRYFFRGVHRPYNDTLAFLLNLLAGPTSDAEAWRALSVIAREDHGPRAELFLASALGGLLSRLEGERRAAAVEALAGLLASERNAGLTTALADNADEAPRRLALALVGRLPSPLDRRLWRPLRGLLADRRLPVERSSPPSTWRCARPGRDGPVVAASSANSSPASARPPASNGCASSSGASARRRPSTPFVRRSKSGCA